MDGTEVEAEADPHLKWELAGVLKAVQRIASMRRSENL